MSRSVNTNFGITRVAVLGKAVNHFGEDFARFYYVVENISVGVFPIYVQKGL